jgi:tetratricopeptide (TPR) repeat protein
LNAEWEKWELADQMADKALQLAANLPEAHTAKARILFQHNWNWKDAEAQFDEALRLGPTNSSALYWAGTFSIWSGRFDEGLLLQKKSVESDPVNSDKMLGYAWSLFHGEKFAEAMEVAKKVNDLAPSRSESHVIVGSVLLGKKEPASALAEFNRADNEYFRQWGRALAYHDLDRRAESDLAVSYLEREGHSDAYVCAQVRAYRGDIDKAFEWLDRGIRNRNLNIVYVKTDSLFKKAFSDPRYKQFLRRLNIPADVNGSIR